MKVLRCFQLSSLSSILSGSVSAFSGSSSHAASRRNQSTLYMVDGVVTETLSGAWASYTEALSANPLLVKSITAGVILGAADLTGQTIQSAASDEPKELDVARFIRFGFFGFILQAPWNHFYYLALDGALPPTVEPWTQTTAVKTVIDQFVQAPVFTVLIFAFLGFLEGKNLEEIKKQLENDYSDTMIANCKR